MVYGKQAWVSVVLTTKAHNSRITCVMVAETEDLIMEYCMTTEKITNMCAKVGEEKSLYGRIRKRHLRDWPDDTLRIKDDGHSKSISEF